MNNRKCNDRCIKCEIYDTLKDFSIDTIVLASAKLICENEKTLTAAKHTEEQRFPALRLKVVEIPLCFKFVLLLLPSVMIICRA